MKTGEKYLDIVLEEMCKRVGITLDKVDLNDEKWFMKHRWTEAEQESFKKWMIDYLYNNREARREMLKGDGIRRTKKELESAVSWFLLDYGWRLI